MARKYLFGTRHRDNIWQRECFNAYVAGRTDGTHPVCNLCGEPVTLDQARRDGWHESHAPERAKAFGGKSVGVAHAACNLAHGRTVVVPAIAKSNRVRKRAERRTFAGSGRYPMRGGHASQETKTMSGGVKRRTTLAEKHAAYIAKRGILTQRAES